MKREAYKVKRKSGSKSLEGAVVKEPGAGASMVPKPDPRPVLLATERDSKQIEAILSAYHLHDVDQADRNLQAMAGEPHHRRQLAEILPILLESLGRTADPDQALNHWERFSASSSKNMPESSLTQAWTG